tara:strand:- start:42 stop:542 length:501 start_codon:yes stop_codon:yes gene_type:complete
MPKLENEKYENFAQMVAKTGNGALSARGVGYAAKHSHITASKLLKIPEIKERVEELKESKKEEINFNVDVVEELEKQYDTAQKKHNITGALKALELIQKVRGNKSSNEIEATEESLEENIKECLNKMSVSRVLNLIMSSNHKKILNSNNQVNNSTNDSQEENKDNS